MRCFHIDCCVQIILSVQPATQARSHRLSIIFYAIVSFAVELHVWTCSETVSESSQVPLQFSLSQSDNFTAQPTMCMELDSNMTYANNG